MKLLCAAVILINSSNFPWTERDFRSKQRAQYVCSTDEYYSDTPCLRSFEKTDELSYRAICGVERE